MDTNYPALPGDISGLEEKIVYVRPVAVADLPREVQEQVEGLDELYSVNDTEGTRIALVTDRHLAFVLAREHDYAPVSVH